jgi:hypothetical protein
LGAFGDFFAVMAAVLSVSVSGARQYLAQQLASHAQNAATSMSVTLGPALGRGDTVLAQAQVHSVFDRGYFKQISVLGTDRLVVFELVLPEKIQGVPAWFVRLAHIEAATGEAFVAHLHRAGAVAAGVLRRVAGFDGRGVALCLAAAEGDREVGP